MASKSILINPSTSIKAIQLEVIPLKSDNQGLIALAQNLIYHVSIKYIDIQHHYICDEVAASQINLQYIPTNEKIADALTKALTHARFHTFVK